MDKLNGIEAELVKPVTLDDRTLKKGMRGTIFYLHTQHHNQVDLTTHVPVEFFPKYEHPVVVPYHYLKRYPAESTGTS